MTEADLIEKIALRVGIKSYLNHGAASCVCSDGCDGVSQEHLIAFAREVALHCAAALAPSPIPARSDSGASNAQLLEALRLTWEVIDAAGLLNLSNGVQLGQTVWYVKASDARALSFAAMEAVSPAKCLTCGGQGLIGGWSGGVDGGYDSQDCPDCAPLSPIPVVEAGGWMPIETAPEDEQVLVYMAAIRAVDIAHKREDNGRWVSGGGTTWPPGTCTHWMALPEAPK